MNASDIHIDQFNRAYFIGIGGIGMSALARYFNTKGWQVAGYDKTRTHLTDQLEEEGIDIHFEDFGSNIPEDFKDHDKTLIIYTPAIPSDFGELQYVKREEFNVFKRAQILGMITRDSKALCVAGTHGKTTTSSMLAHILNTSDLKCNAFLGGISTNFQSNFVGDQKSQYTVIEADEFDRSFLELNPYASIVTSTDADHLDIYEDPFHFIEGFQRYADLISKEGFLIRQHSIELNHPNNISYGIESDSDYAGINLRAEDGLFMMDVQTPNEILEKIELGIPGIHNAENAVACIAMCEQLKISEDVIRIGLKSFQGVKRRFDYQIRTPNLIYIDDYAHHPTEIRALISSVKMLYPNKRITGVFQPHLFSRTRDFFDGFVAELSECDEVILMPIYPAREVQIPGITSDKLSESLTIQDKKVLQPDEVISTLGNRKEGVILTIGAGDIDTIVEPLKKALNASLD